MNNGYDAKGMADEIINAIKNEYRQMTKINIMVLGKTGVGKSTLINSMFSEKLAKTGIGKPITTQISKIEKADFPLAIYDTPGLELGGVNGAQNLLKDVMGVIQKGYDTGEVKNAIHCIWYCVSATSHRFEQAEVEFIRELANQSRLYHVPIIIILTQSYMKRHTKELIQAIQKEVLPVENIIPVLAENYDDDDYSFKAYGLKELAEYMYSIIPDVIKKTFVAIQCVNLELKKKRARSVVSAAAVSAAATGATPIPFSDAILLVPEQVAMIAGITAIFGLPVDKATITALISSTIGTAGTTIMGKTVVSNILKFIPGVGSIAGGLISGATAAALTAALGETFICVMVLICQGDLSMSALSTKDGQKKIAEVFKSQLTMRRNNRGEPI